ncbi:hypothetical protein HPB50_020955 [Hyalomma asiaticum]|uniref:Uncharacterized protein n=1 Tax=Hyalomma asiaticum TaxID=266040 RepID=A0ACB7T0L7_HYAAI|nr:hypothetical protein HPB50_020955 [Hyalomma asiaticum]
MPLLPALTSEDGRTKKKKKKKKKNERGTTSPLETTSGEENSAREKRRSQLTSWSAPSTAKSWQGRASRGAEPDRRRDLHCAEERERAGFPTRSTHTHAHTGGAVVYRPTTLAALTGAALLARRARPSAGARARPDVGGETTTMQTRVAVKRPTRDSF